MTFLNDELNIQSVKKIALTPSNRGVVYDDSPLDYTYIDHIAHHESFGGNLHGTTRSADNSSPGSKVYIWYLHM